MKKSEFSVSVNKLDKIINSINSVIKDVINFRKVEGKNLMIDLKENLITIKLFISKIEKISGIHSKTIKKDLENKLQSLNAEYDLVRLEQELLYYIEKMDINEELVRLNSHINFFTETLDSSSNEKGKKVQLIKNKNINSKYLGKKNDKISNLYRTK